VVSGAAADGPGRVRAEARAKQLGLFPLAEVYRHIGAWIARIEALPGDDRTYPPHWR
jgi:hypothetical protein